MRSRNGNHEKLVIELREESAVEDAFLAKSFTDRLLVVDVCESQSLPEEATDRIIECGFRPAERIYAGEKAGDSFVGDVGDAARHHFVDVHTRGSHQSYVVE